MRYGWNPWTWSNFPVLQLTLRKVRVHPEWAWPNKSSHQRAQVVIPTGMYLRGVLCPALGMEGAHDQDFAAEDKIWAMSFRNQILPIALGAWKRTRPQLSLPDLES